MVDDPRDQGDDTPPDPGPEPSESKNRARDGAPSLTSLPGGAAVNETGGNGSIADQTTGEPETDEDQDQLFFVIGGKEIKLGPGLAKSKTPIEVKYVLSGKSIPHVTGGVVDPYATSVLLLADCVVDYVKPQYIRDAQQRVEKIVLYVTLKPRVVQQAFSEAGKVMMDEARKAEAAA